MIVKMKKATLLCLLSDKEAALESLRELGVMHVELLEKVESQDISSAAAALAAAERAESLLAGVKPVPGARPSGKLDGAAVCRKAAALQEAEAAASKRIESLTRDKDRLLPWGDFSASMIGTLKEKGLHVYLCIGSKEDIDALPEGAAASVVTRNGSTLYYAVTSVKPLDPSALHAASLPDASLSEVCAGIDNARQAISEAKIELEALSAELSVLRAHRMELEEKLEFLTNRDAMAVSGSIAYLQGYIPVDAEAPLREAALKHGWGLVLESPTLDDCPPTLIRKPVWMNVIDPVFALVGISPGYREFDVSIFFLIFFTIFFGMIMGDSGYAMGFLAIALLAKTVVKDPKMKVPINLFILLSGWTLVWGLLTGCFFGIPAKWLEEHHLRLLAGLPFFADPENSPFAQSIAHKFGLNCEEIPDKLIQWFCFFLAALHLASARVYRGFAEIKHSWHGFGDFGWALLIFGNFLTAVNLIVFKDSFPSYGIWLYIAAFVIIIGSLDWKDVGHLMHLPFAFIGSFVDVLSYIRLFAVGMSGLFISRCFNQMGGMAYDTFASSMLVVAIIFAIIVIIFGHVLNIALASLGVLVHAIRLNSLEFSNQMELQWTGFKYKPFAKNDSNIQQ